MPDFKNFFGKKPDHQLAFDLFDGEWSTRLPDDYTWIAGTGETRLCEDSRIQWAAEKLGGFSGKRILELGPLEGGHSYMLEKMGAASVTAIEANARAYLKCLILKEALGLQKVRFLPGDFAPWLRETSDSFDAAIACGVLYHMTNPVEVLDGLAKHCAAVFAWTHYFDPAYFAANAHAAGFFEPAESSTHAGFKHTLYRRKYADALQWKGFCGGGASAGAWLIRADLLGALEHFGFQIVATLEDNNPNGPAIMIAATRAHRH